MLRYILQVLEQGWVKRDTWNKRKMNGSIDRLAPGTFVRSPANPDWGLGQVRSAIGNRVTVNFEHRGKLVLNLAAAPLMVVDMPGSESANK
ncbi:MAG TPA: DUF3553 domain-containing protein [Sphingomicrobium sp.]|nr:DUF3553 domain-containing protein [Sphingomicrobium sp.]